MREAKAGDAANAADSANVSDDRKENTQIPPLQKIGLLNKFRCSLADRFVL
jgi:hypothetical protein